MEIRRASTSAEVLAAAGLFDDQPQGEATERFLDTPGHHLLLAWEGDRPVGMVTGVEMTMPDKGTEMFLYELGVAEGARNRGVGSALVAALHELARATGCYGMWVLTDDDNHAALEAYRRTPPQEESPNHLIGWSF